MSSNQNNGGSQTRRVRSISRRLAKRNVRRKIRVSLAKDLLVVLTIFITWLAVLEITATGRLALRENERVIFMNTEQEEDEAVDAPGAVEYRVIEKATGKVLVSDYPFRYAKPILLTAGIVFLVQTVLHLMSYPAENSSVKKILRPLEKLSEKADELARYDLSEDKYRIIENSINSLEPDDEQLISLGDEDLMGIENAMNSLLVRIRENNRQQARFVNDASHELRTPIAVIQGYANMLARWGREDEKVLDESITAIQNESDNMKHLVDQLLFLARGDLGKMQLSIAPTSMNGLMREVYEESLMIDENHIYRLAVPEEDITVDADEGLIKQAVRILVDNAAKYTREKDEILLGVGKGPDGSVFLRVQDCGIGMSEKDVAHMFERFYRADEARTYNGTGLGLSIAKWIVDKHGGHFEVVSREDLGTRIDIYMKTAAEGG